MLLHLLTGQLNAFVASVALAYVMQKTPYVFPIVGGRKVEHLMDNIAALEIALSDEQVKYLEEVLPFVRGFPHDMIVSSSAAALIFAELLTDRTPGRWVELRVPVFNGWLL